jgi:putative tricarboxylic transport membrane protein
MDSAPGLVMLTAVYTYAIYGGSVTACRFTRLGNAGIRGYGDGWITSDEEGKRPSKLWGISTISSMIGGTISAVALLVI